MNAPRGRTSDLAQRYFSTAAFVWITRQPHSWSSLSGVLLLPDTTLPRYSEVHKLIASLGRVSGEDQQRAFNRLEALGQEAVPAIIAQMDDRRALRTAAISLANHSPDAFESVRHCGPKQVVDGLDAVLNQITGQSFGSIMNGGSDRQRDAAVAGWRIYAADRDCA
jgi:hypothetical protein